MFVVDRYEVTFQASSVCTGPADLPQAGASLSHSDWDLLAAVWPAGHTFPDRSGSGWRRQTCRQKEQVRCGKREQRLAPADCVITGNLGRSHPQPHLICLASASVLINLLTPVRGLDVRQRRALPTSPATFPQPFASRLLQGISN